MGRPGGAPENLKPCKKGETNNPNGRPKGRRNMSTILKEMLCEKIDVIIDGKKVKREFQDVIIRKLLKKANDGDIKAIIEIFDRMEGKSKQSMEVIMPERQIIETSEPLFDDPEYNSSRQDKDPD